MQLEELLANIESDGRLVIEDYMSHSSEINPADVLKRISTFAYDELMDLTCVCACSGLLY